MKKEFMAFYLNVSLMYVNLWVLRGIAVYFPLLKTDPMEFLQCAIFFVVSYIKNPESLIFGKCSKILWKGDT